MIFLQRQNHNQPEPFQHELATKWCEINSLISQNHEWGKHVNNSESKIPLVDIFEDDQLFMVNVELPGFSSDDIMVEIAQDHIFFQAEKKRQQNDSSGKIRRYERDFGVFSRHISFPVEVNPNQAKASYDDGVLSISLPKEKFSHINPIDIEFLN